MSCYHHWREAELDDLAAEFRDIVPQILEVARRARSQGNHQKADRWLAMATFFAAEQARIERRFQQPPLTN
jgi:hypothetical protein